MKPTTIFLFAGVGLLMLAGCQQSSPRGAMDTSPAAEKVVRLHFDGFSKSKSGATWMAWPDAVNEALSGLPGIVETQMLLERDEFEVKYDSSKVGEAQILEACKKSGFPATIVTGDLDPSSHTPGADADDTFDPPQFYRDALIAAESENKPIVIDFMATWCAPCKRLSEETLVDPAVVELLGQCILLKIDTDEHPALARHFNVSALPDIRLLRPDGSQYKQITGFQEVDSMAAQLRELLDHVKQQ